MYDMSEIRKGLKIEVDGQPYEVVDFQHVKPGKGGAFVRTRLRNLLTTNVVDKTFRATERVGIADTDQRKMQYLYVEGDSLIFMDQQTYDQTSIKKDVLGDSVHYLQENAEVYVLFYRGQPISVSLPNFIVTVITQTDPGVKGDTVSGGSKRAVVATGASVQVPLFIKEGEKIKVDTRTGEYVERVAG